MQEVPSLPSKGKISWIYGQTHETHDEGTHPFFLYSVAVGKLSLSSKTMKRTMLKDLSVEIACLTNEGIIFQKQERFVFTVVLEDLDSKIVGVARNDDQNDKILAIGPHTSGDPAAQNPLSAPSRSSSITSACYYCSLPNWPARSR